MKKIMVFTSLFLLISAGSVFIINAAEMKSASDRPGCYRMAETNYRQEVARCRNNAKRICNPRKNDRSNYRKCIREESRLCQDKAREIRNQNRIKCEDMFKY